jgi:DNA polymerase
MAAGAIHLAQESIEIVTSCSEVQACRPWLVAEMEIVRPTLIVYLGPVAAQALLGSKFKITQSHGTVQRAENLPPIIAPLHPSAILRRRTDDDRHALRSKPLLIYQEALLVL